MTDYPHGSCDCNSGLAFDDGEGCCLGTGPAAFEVERDKRKMRVCTRCSHLTGDKNLVQLVRATDSTFEIFSAFDPLGALVLSLRNKGPE